MDLKGMLGQAMSQGAEGQLQEHIPAIQTLLREQVGNQLREHLSDPAKLSALCNAVYTRLPMPLRSMLSEEAFVQFCQTHKDRLLSGA